ncbi:MAG: prepilin-type N-terminal cleavage/methylation domain-containing protein [Sneathiellaceae bacterium]
MTRPDTEAGMTLIEVLVAITLLAMLATMIAQGARLTGRAWSTAEQRTNDVDDIETVRALLRRTITRAQPSFASADLSDLAIQFDGQPERLTLIAPRSGIEGGGEWVRQVLYVAPYEGAQGLYLAWQVDAPQRGGREIDTGPGATDRALLLDHVESVRFGYFGPPSPGEPPTWLTSWTGRQRLPTLVRIEVARDGAARRPWPALTMRTRVNTNPGCLYDAGRYDCRRASQ